MFIKVEFEYDFNGSFGGNNNQGVFKVADNLSSKEVDKKVREKLSSITGLDSCDVQELVHWEVLEIEEL